ncbi:indole-3-glycerol phosphate synthase [Streptomyces sp. RFCAC02]|uniref:indole-3-glycerol phosphate synthase n=1 Tax=Streptomyces sp. RFCAC02 TaxID=2499143 RepID=UPI00101F4973|nr:indole-3-glycerol phosphate synthase [Streptomyces sp. RFCAC02]
MVTTVLMIEKAIAPADVDLVTTLHEDERQSFVVLMQPRGDQDQLLRALDDVAVGQLAGAVHEADLTEGTTVEEDGEEPTTAQHALDLTLRALRAAGTEAVGRLAGDKPLDALTAVVRETNADEVVVLTAPHYVEELFHRDWASRARHKVGVPVLRLFAHTA